MAPGNTTNRLLAFFAGVTATLIVTADPFSQYLANFFTVLKAVPESINANETPSSDSSTGGSFVLRKANDPHLMGNHIKPATGTHVQPEGLLFLPTGMTSPWATDLRSKDFLSDPENRIDDAFNVPDPLKNRVRFWFEVYTRFDETKRIIHHVHYPWVIYKIVDVEPILFAKFPSRRWQRNIIADQLVERELLATRKRLRALARMPKSKLTPQKLTPEEQELLTALNQSGISIEKAVKSAFKNVRVQTGQRNFFASGLQTAPRYLQDMERIFREHSLPVELTRIPLVESSFNGEAHSKVGAVGIWQFMEGTARSMRLRVDSQFDERRSPLKATAAAARLLKENHLILKRSWPLAVTAWNHGPNGVRKAMRAVGSHDLAEIVGAYKTASFSFASENFYAEFLAALYAESYAHHTFPGLPREAPLNLALNTAKQSTSVGALLNQHSVTAFDFAQWNPDFVELSRKQKRQNGARSFSIKIPKGFSYYLATDDSPKLAQAERDSNYRTQ